MARVIKWFALGVVAVVALLVLLVVAIMLLVDPNDYRDDISRIVEEQTGQELVIEGDIRLSFFPWLGLDLGRTRLENREGFGDDPFVSIESAGIAVKLLPLLRREVVLDTIRLDGLRANLIVNEAGEANWELALDELDDDVAVPDDAPRPGDAPDGEGVDSLPVSIGPIAGVDISDAHVTYADWQTGESYAAGPLNLRLGELVFDDDVSLNADWVVALADGTRLEGSLEALLRVSEDVQRLRAEILGLDLVTFAEGLPESGLETRLTGLAHADLGADTATVEGLALDVAGLRFNADVEVTDLTAGPHAEGRFDVPEVNLRRVLETLGQDLPEGDDAPALERFLAEGRFSADESRVALQDLRLALDDAEVTGGLRVDGFPDDIAVVADWDARVDAETRIEGALRAAVQASEEFQVFTGALESLDVTLFAADLPEAGVRAELASGFRADLNADTASVQDFSLRSAGMTLNAGLEVTGLTTEPRAQGSVAIPTFNLREALVQLGQEVPDTADPEVLTRVGLEGRFNVGEVDAEIADLRVELDDTRFDGNARVANFAEPAVAFELAGTRMDADRYLPPGSDEEGGGAVAMGESDDADEEAMEIPLELLRALNLDGRIAMEQLKIAGFDLSAITVEVLATDGVIRIHPLQAALYGGRYEGDIRLDATGERLVVEVDEQLMGIQAQPVMQQFLGRDFLQGTGGLRLQGRSEGLDPMELLRELVAQIELDFADGAVAGINIAQTVRGATARMQGRSVQEEEPQVTDFSRLRGRLNINRGQLSNDNLRVESPLFRMEGAGRANIFEQSVDYGLTVNIVDSLEGQGGAALQQLRGVAVPLRFSGSLLSPSVSVDLANVLTSEQMQRLRDGEAALRDRAREEEERLRERAREEEEQLRQRAREEEEELRQRAREEEQRARERLREQRERREEEAGERLRDGLRRLLD